MKPLPQYQEDFVRQMQDELWSEKRHNKTSVEKIAKGYGITDKTLTKELSELAIVREARKIAHKEHLNREQKFRQITELYYRQVNLSHRTSQSVLLQQYSTPAPIAYLAGVFTGIDQSKTIRCFEPSAGNGMLTIAGNPEQFTVNEVDKVRRANLNSQPFEAVINRDASESFGSEFYQRFDVVISNPPFGSLGEKVLIGKTKVQSLDHLMALKALDTMADSGRAAIIIGGLSKWDDRGRIQQGKNRSFFHHLYAHYHIEDVLQINGHKLYSRMGTAFHTRLILISGRKPIPEGTVPLKQEKDVLISSFDELYNRVIPLSPKIPKPSSMTIMKEKARVESLARRGIELQRLLSERFGSALGAPYIPAAQACIQLNTVVPDSMDYEIRAALARVRNDIGIPIEDFVLERLGYQTHIQLCNSLSAEQTDAVALAIYNIEHRSQGMIIGDQTGIGKGRVAAAMIRYGVKRGYRPIFLTEKPNLFSDLYRDLVAIGSGDLMPFIVNSRSAKTHVKDQDGNVIYQAPKPEYQEEVFRSGKIPYEYDFVMATYSQFNQPGRKPLKPDFLRELAIDNIMVLDESHNASGMSKTGLFLSDALSRTKGVTFLSATFAKRPDNMPIYAIKTAISDANLTTEGLIQSVERGGVALQEVLSSQLVAEGQMIRRERSFEGVEVNYIYLDRNAKAFGMPDKEQEHKATFDLITDIMREIIEFQKTMIEPVVERLDNQLAVYNIEAETRKGTQKAGVDNSPYFSKVFQTINQLLFALKAESVAELAIKRLREGKKPVIAFSSTMASFYKEMTNLQGDEAKVGDTIRADFASVLHRGLDSVLKITVVEPDMTRHKKSIDIADLGSDARAMYKRIASRIKNVSSGITISPIDQIKQIIQAAGFRVSEVTGRSHAIELDMDTLNPVTTISADGSISLSGEITGKLVRRKKENTNDAFRKFNDNEADVLLINQSGSTGASAHAIPTRKVSKEEVRQRVMIVLQAELNINTEIQKRGRINRTGQIYKPVYDYVISAVPAEKRLMMMLQRKLKSLDANTTSNQKQSEAILNTDDFLNKYGDKVVEQWLNENPVLNMLLGDPIGEESRGAKRRLSHFVSGRVAVLDTKDQEKFYREVLQGYNTYIELLKDEGKYDLEMEVLDLQAKTLESDITIVGKTKNSVFGDDTVLEKVEIRNYRKPFSRRELADLISKSLGGKTPQQISEELVSGHKSFNEKRLEDEVQKLLDAYEKKIGRISVEKRFEKLDHPDDRIEYYNSRKRELEVERNSKLSSLQKENALEFSRIQGLFRYFIIGKGLNISNGHSNSYDPVVFLGFVINFEKANPYVPSGIRLRFAFGSSRKYSSLPYSGDSKQTIDAIKGASMNLSYYQSKEIFDSWDEFTREKQGEWIIRNIITGNILQGMSRYQGRLISYTTRDGKTRKGLLQPESFDVKKDDRLEVTLPIIKALPLFKSLVVGKHIDTRGGAGFIRGSLDSYDLYVPASKVRGAKYYTDEGLLEFLDKGMFEKVSDQMRAEFPVERLTDVIEYFQKAYSDSVRVSQQDFLRIKDQLTDNEPREPLIIEPTRRDDEEEEERIRILGLKAKALKIKLQLLSL